jgi:hypothetical protein
VKTTHQWPPVHELIRMVSTMTEEEWQHLYENFERKGPDYDDDYSALR